MRLFAAIDCPYNYKLAYSRLYPVLRKKYNKVKWVDPENLHITLAFFGEADNFMLSKIEKALDRVKLDKNFLVKASFYDFMPRKNPRVIFQKITSGHSFCRHINIQMQKLFPDLLTEKRLFKAHLTLGRIKAPFFIDIPELESMVCEFTCSEFCLFESELNKGRCIYKIIKKYIFAEA